MALSCVKFVFDNLMSTIELARVSYLISDHNLVTRYIMRPNPDGTRSVIFTHPHIMVTITSFSNEVVGQR